MPTALIAAGSLAALLGSFLLTMTVRTSLITGAAWWLRGSRLGERRRIFRLPLATGQLASELKATVAVLLFDALVLVLITGGGLLRAAPFSWAATAATFAAIFGWFECWFYVSHRLLHTRALYWIHAQHHVARIVDPLAALSFSLIERALLVLGGLGFACALSWLMPVTVAGVAAYFLVNYALNVLGHSNVDLTPGWVLRAPLGRRAVTPTFHALHHARLCGHYGLFTTVLDDCCGTAFADYPAAHQRVRDGEGLTRLQAPKA